MAWYEETDLTAPKIDYGVLNVSDIWGHALLNKSRLKSSKNLIFGEIEVWK